MNYIVISPYYPHNFQKFSIELKNQGINVLGIGEEPYEQLDQRLKEALTEYFRVNSLDDVDEVKRAVAFLYHKHGHIDRIESQNEHWMELDAALRTQFNVFGLKEHDLKKTKHKSEMKKYFEKAGVPVVPGFLVKKEGDIEKGVKKLKLPLIAKPDNGVGASATYKLKDKKDVENFKKEWDGTTHYFLEPFVDNSDIVTFDGLVDAKGNIVFYTSIVYYHTPLDLLNNNTLDWVYYIDKDLDPKLVEYGKNAVKAFGMKERFFHIEFFKTKDDYIAIEYNNRPAGAFAVDVYNFAHSTDYFRVYAEVVNGTFNGLNVDEKYGLASTRRDYKDYVYSDEDIRNKYQDKLKAVLRMPEAFAELQGNTMYVLVADTLEEMREMERFVGKLK